MKYFSKVLLASLLLVICTLCACGKVSEPVPYENSGYPHQYPHR